MTINWMCTWVTGRRLTFRYLGQEVCYNANGCFPCFMEVNEKFGLSMGSFYVHLLCLELRGPEGKN